jgi:hypothetical protein
MQHACHLAQLGFLDPRAQSHCSRGWSLTHDRVHTAAFASSRWQLWKRQAHLMGGGRLAASVQENVARRGSHRR